MTPTNISPLRDAFGRQVTYLRMSVTDRCDLRCTYCMAEHMTFLPRKDLLTLEELEAIAAAFIRRGVRKIRITGGEPLVRRDVIQLFATLGAGIGNGLDELTLTTNATLLDRYACALAEAGVRRVNVSLDSLRPEVFRRVTRRGDLRDVLRGIDAARDAGLRVKINTVALRHENADEIPDIVAWAHHGAMDMTIIEVMPLGETGEDRFDQYIPLSEVREQLEARWTLSAIDGPDENAGPARYVKVRETGGRLGFITPLTNNFCSGCNRVRVTCTGRIYMCLGHDRYVDLREALRSGGSPAAELDAALDRALLVKPERHDFKIERPGSAAGVARHMSVTGG